MIQRTSEKSSNLPARSYKVRLRPAKERTAQVHLAVSYAMRVRMILSTSKMSTNMPAPFLNLRLVSKVAFKSIGWGASPNMSASQKLLR
jgi:hypothetical protein